MAEKKADPKIYVASDLEDVASCLKNLAPDLDIEDIPISGKCGMAVSYLRQCQKMLTKVPFISKCNFIV